MLFTSHLASLQMMRLDKNHTTTYLRVGVIVVFATFLTITIDLNRYAYQPAFVVMEQVLVNHLHFSEDVESVLEYLVPPLIMFWIFWISIAQLVEPWNNCWLRQAVKAKRRYSRLAPFGKAVLRFVVFGHPLAVFFLQVTFAGISVTCALLQRFTPAPQPTPSEIANGVGKWCDLRSTENNIWSYGQTTALILLILPIYSTVHEFLG